MRRPDINPPECGKEAALSALKAIGIAGSPRRSGNSTTLMDAVLAGAAGAGAETEAVFLNDLSFRGCQGCEPCASGAGCILTDELTPVMARVRDADIWVLASPIYYDGVSGQLKLFFDRLRHVTHDGPPLKPQLTGKRAAAIVVTYEDKKRDDYRRVADTLGRYLSWMGEFITVEVMDEARLGPSDAVAGRPELVERARRIGEKLYDALRASPK